MISSDAVDGRDLAKLPAEPLDELLVDALRKRHPRSGKPTKWMTDVIG
jgi:hypothetical protein